MLEAYTTLGYFAALTQTTKLGVQVTGVIYGYPGILVKTVATLDVLSGGAPISALGLPGEIIPALASMSAG